jgi:hypothetical protein
VEGTEVGIFEEIKEVSLSSLLDSEDSGGLESDVLVELRGDTADESLEGELSDEVLGGVLKTSELTESNSSGSESAGLIDSTTTSNEASDLWQLLSDMLSGSHATGHTLSG